MAREEPREERQLGAATRDANVASDVGLSSPQQGTDRRSITVLVRLFNMVTLEALILPTARKLRPVQNQFA